MIDPKKPDYQNTPASDARPASWYRAAEERTPLVSVVTPYYNTGPVFWETFRSVQRQSLPYWEWLIVDDESTDAASLEQLRLAQEQEPRIRVLRQTNGGPAVARNHAVREARGKYLLILDSDDMIEPTFVEKAVWFLETQPPAFAAVNAYNVTFGSKNLLWPYGFERGSENLRENYCTIQSVVRASDYRAVGGFDESISYEHADWDFWLTLASAGLWGYTLPEYLTWYRTQERSLMTEIEGDRERATRFRTWLTDKHRAVARRFPNPKPLRAGYVPEASHYAKPPIENPLAKPSSTKRVLFIAPWMEVGGADQLNLDMVRELTRDGYECTVVTTLRNDNPWQSRFTDITPDVFSLHSFLNFADHPRFLSYLIESRQVDAVVVSNTEFGYEILPYLRARHPHVALLDYTHAEEPAPDSDGYPGKSVEAGDTLDLRMTNTDHMRQWLIAHGAPGNTIEVRRCAIDTETWRPDATARATARTELGVADETPVIVFVGRMAAVKRPHIFAETLNEVARQGVSFAAFAVGAGEELNRLRLAVRAFGLTESITLLGQLPSDATRRVMQAADILLLPSAMEGLAVVLIEAMALGVVPVVSRVGGQHEIVAPDAGYLVAPGPGDVGRYAEAVKTLATSPKLRSAMAIAARRCVEPAFSMTTFAEGVRQSIDRAIALAGARTEQPHPAANDLARSIVASLAPADIIEARWAARNRHPVVGYLRQLRQVVVPMGTARYAAYARFRQQLRELAPARE